MKNEKIVFVRRISKVSGKLIISIPKDYYNKVKHGKYYRVILEPLED